MATPYAYSFTWDAPLDAIHAMWTDPAFQEQRSQAGSPIRAEAAEHQISVFRLLRIEPPGFIAKFVGDSIGIQETQVWSTPESGTLLVEIQKQPGDVRGSIRAAESDGATAVTISAEVAVRVPLLGGKVEGYVVGILDQLMKSDERLGRQWLAARGEAPAAG